MMQPLCTVVTIKVATRSHVLYCHQKCKRSYNMYFNMAAINILYNKCFLCKQGDHHLQTALPKSPKGSV